MIPKKEKGESRALGEELLLFPVLTAPSRALSAPGEPPAVPFVILFQLTHPKRDQHHQLHKWQILRVYFASEGARSCRVRLGFYTDPLGSHFTPTRAGHSPKNHPPAAKPRSPTPRKASRAPKCLLKTTAETQENKFTFSPAI